MGNIGALLITLVAGIFFLFGFILVRFVKRKKELTILATSMALVVMLGMVFFDLMPEILEMSEVLYFDRWQKLLYILIFMFIGMFILKIFDIFLPHHHHEHHDHEKNHEEHNSHLVHIGFIMTASLILHNILEGMSIYIIGTESLATGFLTALAVGCHNLPLGIEVASSMEVEKNNGLLKKVIAILLVLSSSFGAIILYLLGGNIPTIVLLALISLACGMILYIALFELLVEVMSYLKRRETYYGMAIGVIVLLLMTFIH